MLFVITVNNNKLYTFDYCFAGIGEEFEAVVTRLVTSDFVIHALTTRVEGRPRGYNSADITCRDGVVRIDTRYEEI